MIANQCPNPDCGRSYQIDDDRIGQRAKCVCGHSFVVSLSHRDNPSEDDSKPEWMKRTDGTASADKDTVSTSNPPPMHTKDGDLQFIPLTVKYEIPSEPLPESVGRFKIVSRLGAGGYGVVYRARDPHMNRDVAVKLPKSTTFSSEESLTRFVREAQTAGQLRHPNIVTIFEVSVEANQFYIVSDFVDGQPLNVVINRGSIDQVDAARIALKLALALDYAHREGIIHRDVKPSNVILDQDGIPHLLDFGLARLEDDGHSITQTGSVLAAR